MKKLLLIMAASLLPASANAQMRLDFDADAYYDEPAVAGSAADHAPTRSETSADKARTVRHGERTVLVANEAPAVTGNKTRLAVAHDPY
jgi:hypothetical protein